MTREGLTEENLRDGSVKDISHRSRGRPENKEEFVPERERKKAENEDSKSGKGKRLQMEKIRKSSVRQEAVEDTVEVTPEEKVDVYKRQPFTQDCPMRTSCKARAIPFPTKREFWKPMQSLSLIHIWD